MKKTLIVMIALAMALTSFASALAPPDYYTADNVEELVYWIVNHDENESHYGIDYKETLKSLRQKEYLLVPETFEYVTVYPGADEGPIGLLYNCRDAGEYSGGYQVYITAVNKKYEHLIKEGIDEYFNARYDTKVYRYGYTLVEKNSVDVLKSKKSNHIFYITDNHEVRVSKYQSYPEIGTVPLRKIPLDSVPWLIEKAYDDVGENDWFYEDVEYTAFKKIWNKTEENTFSPNLPADRATIAAALYAVAGSPWEQIRLPTFSDVSADADYAKAIAWAEKNNIVKGFEENLFLPERNISRQDFAVMLLRYLDYIGYEYDMPTGNLTFSDSAQVAEYAQKAVKVMCDLRIIKGKNNNTLDPRGDITRAESAAVFHRLMKLMGK